ncbi:MAG: hypothetical protein QF371_06220, partial [Flavobacteriales bacterium]|nr:hypothetical protein [Flavobacteriales bacterium]
SKLVIAAAGDKVRELSTSVNEIDLPAGFSEPRITLPGVLIIKGPKYINNNDIQGLSDSLAHQQDKLTGLPLIVLVDDSEFVAMNINNFLWVTFTRNNPSHDVHGVAAFEEHKHWGCRSSIIFDSRIKPHHAPELVKDPVIEKKVDILGEKGGSLYGII